MSARLTVEVMAVVAEGNGWLDTLEILTDEARAIPGDATLGDIISLQRQVTSIPGPGDAKMYRYDATFELV